MMKDIFIVGESVPLRNDGANYRVTACGQLGRQLEDFDPRHGVFCNFVATPLLATICALTEQNAESTSVVAQLGPILADTTDRRFNLFKAKKKEPEEPFVIRDDLLARVVAFDPDKHLWLLTGFQTAFGLLAWLLDDKQTTVWKRTQIEELAFAFLTAASTHDSLLADWPRPVTIKPKQGIRHCFIDFVWSMAGKKCLQRLFTRWRKQVPTRNESLESCTRRCPFFTMKVIDNNTLETCRDALSVMPPVKQQTNRTINTGI